MIVSGGAIKIYIATKPVDFREGMDSLALLVEQSLGLDPHNGAVYVFRSKRADRLKILRRPLNTNSSTSIGLQSS